MGALPGAFAEYALMDARGSHSPFPPAVVGGGASVPLTFMVVHDMLIAQGRIAAGEWLLVTGISSGVGSRRCKLRKRWRESDRHLGLGGQSSRG